MNRFAFASIHLVLAALAGCDGKLAVTQTEDESSGAGGTSDGGNSGSGGSSSSQGGASGGAVQGGTNGGDGGDPASGGANGGDGGDPASGGANGGDGGGPASGGANGGDGGDPASGGAAGGSATDHCNNQLKDVGESDIDCGGAECPACGTDAVCVQTSDCESHVCRASRCREPACDDKVQNGDETGVDCGGSCIDGARGFCKVTPTECACATSAGLSAIACGVTVEPWDNTAHIDATGDTAALALCVDSACDAHRWSVADGLVSLELGATVRGISQDGRAVLVMHRPMGLPFLWQTGDVRTAIPDMEMLDLSADGTTVLGVSGAPARWTAAGGLKDVSTTSRLAGWAVMTPDGVFIAAQYSPPAGAKPLVRWNAVGEETILSAIPEQGYSFTEAISDDGQVVAGTWESIAGGAHVYRWSGATGVVTLGASPPPNSTNSTSYPPRLNADGSVMLGNYQPSSDVSSMAFRWTQAAGISDFANSPPEGSVVLSASADAGVAIGYTLESTAQPPFVWDDANGLRPLRAVLESAEIDLEGWELGKPLALSADGKVVLGQGTCGGEPAVFRAVLP